MFVRTASYVDRIPKTGNPATCRSRRPTTFELVIDLKTAAALDLTIPRSLLQGTWQGCVVLGP
jgi:putative ABC transport system substrate-binding protein